MELIIGKYSGVSFNGKKFCRFCVFKVIHESFPTEAYVTWLTAYRIWTGSKSLAVNKFDKPSYILQKFCLWKLAPYIGIQYTVNAVIVLL